MAFETPKKLLPAYQPTEDDKNNVQITGIEKLAFLFCGMVVTGETVNIVFNQLHQSYNFFSIILSIIVPFVVVYIVLNKLAKTLHLQSFVKAKNFKINQENRQIQAQNDEIQRHNEQARQHNADAQREAEVDFKEYKQNEEKRKEEIQRELSILQNYTSVLKDMENTVKEDQMKENEKQLNDLLAVKKEFIASNQHKVIPKKHQFNWSYFDLLYELIDTEQASSVPEAIRIAEERYLKIELVDDLKEQMVKSQKALEEKIGQVGERISDEIAQAKAATAKVEQQLKENSQKLSLINDTVHTANYNVINQMQSMSDSFNSAIYTLNETTNSRLSEINDGISQSSASQNDTLDRTTADAISSINTTINNNFRALG